MDNIVKNWYIKDDVKCSYHIIDENGETELDKIIENEDFEKFKEWSKNNCHPDLNQDDEVVFSYMVFGNRMRKRILIDDPITLK